MKTALLIPLGLALPLVLHGSPVQEPEAPRSEAETELARRMTTIEEAVKELRKLLRGTDVTASLASLERLQAESLLSKVLIPAAAVELPPAERDSLARAYRRTMVDFLARQLELEAALLDGDGEAARQAFEQIRAMEDSAHERFAPEER